MNNDNLLRMHLGSRLGLICLHSWEREGEREGEFYCQRNILFKEFVLAGDEQEYRPLEGLSVEFCQSILKGVFNLTC